MSIATDGSAGGGRSSSATSASRRKLLDLTLQSPTPPDATPVGGTSRQPRAQVVASLLESLRNHRRSPSRQDRGVFKSCSAADFRKFFKGDGGDALNLDTICFENDDEPTRTSTDDCAPAQQRRKFPLSPMALRRDLLTGSTSRLSKRHQSYQPTFGNGGTGVGAAGGGRKGSQAAVPAAGSTFDAPESPPEDADERRFDALGRCRRGPVTSGTVSGYGDFLGDEMTRLALVTTMPRTPLKRPRTTENRLPERSPRPRTAQGDGGCAETP